MEKLLFIFNPLAGKGVIRGHLLTVLDTFTKAGYLVTAYPTQSKGDAARAAAQWGGGHDRVVCCGGDGTLSETIFGLLDLERRPVLGYLPTGTTNDFSRNLSLPKDLRQAARTAVSGPVRACDVGRFNRKAFIYVAAFGAFTDVSYDTPQEFKNTFGHLAYVLAGVTRLGSLKTYRLEVTHDQGRLEGEFLYGMVSNTMSVGGFKSLTPAGVSLDDGLFEVLLVRRPQTMAQLQRIIQGFLQKDLDSDMMVSLRTSRLEIAGEEHLPWTLDGEYGGDPLRAEIVNDRQAIRLVWGG